MARLIRGIGYFLGALTLLLAPALLACSEASREDTFDGPAGRHDLGPATADGGTVDPGVDAGAPMSPGFQGIPPSDSLGGVREDDEAAGDFAGVLSCYDGLDNNDDPLVDCADPACFALGSCCVDSGRDACCAGPETLVQQSFDGCGSASGCIAGATLFGAPAPFISGGALALGGDALYDSGVLVAEPLDLRGERVELSATFVDTTTCAGCLDGAAFGVTAQTALDDRAHVEPLVALQRNAGDDVRLRVGDRTLLRIRLVEGEPITLVLRPDGEGEVHHGGEVHRFDHPVHQVVHAVAWGFSSNPSASAPEGVYLDDLSLSRAHCGIADGWLERGPTAGATDDGLLGVAAATDAEGTTWLALWNEDALTLATVAPEGALAASSVTVGEVVWGTDPHGWGLTFDGTDLWLTFVADHELGASMGRARLVESTFEPEPEPFFRAASPIGSPQWVSAFGYELVVSAWEAGVGLWARGPDLPTPDEWHLLDGDVAGLGAKGAVEPDLVWSPEGAWLLHYAQPVGTRWRIGLVASDELVAWRPLDDVLGGSGDLDDFDALGATSPAVTHEGDQLSLHYIGLAPAATRLGHARRWLGASR